MDEWHDIPRVGAELFCLEHPIPTNLPGIIDMSRLKLCASPHCINPNDRKNPLCDYCKSLCNICLQKPPIYKSMTICAHCKANYWKNCVVKKCTLKTYCQQCLFRTCKCGKRIYFFYKACRNCHEYIKNK